MGVKPSTWGSRLEWTLAGYRIQKTDFSVGAILVITGLTGTLLAFYVEIERGLYTHMQTAHPHALPSSYEGVYQRLAQLPPVAPGGTWSIEIPPDGGVITSRRYYSALSETALRPTRMVTLDPLTFDVLRDADCRLTVAPVARLQFRQRTLYRGSRVKERRTR